MKQLILMNKSGDLCAGIRLTFFDKYSDDEIVIENLHGFKVSVSSVEPDAWAIMPYEGHPWVMLTPTALRNLEVLGDL